MMYSTFNNKTFFSNNTIIFEPSTSGSYTLLTATSANVIVSAICLTFMIRKLTLLNKFIKISLCIMAIQNIICSLLMTCSNISMLVYPQKSLLSCLFLTQPILISNRSNWTVIAVISTLRYLMAWKASQTR